MSATTHPSIIVPLGRAGDFPRETVGGKARELGWLIASGFRVPDGYVITTDAWAQFADSDETALPEELVKLLSSETPRAYRSSAVSEDGEHASFAGQYESVLDVRGFDRGVEALRRCWASARSAALEEYVHSVAHVDGGLAVIVQEMVAADCAGVTFTRNPITGADEMLVEATTGLGDQLMEGLVEPERWSVVSDAPARRLSGPVEVLDGSQLAELTRVCAQIAETRGGPQDIEWAFSGGTLYILQSRPVTALPVEPERRPPARQTWERDDSHFPTPVLPLPATCWLPAHARCLARMAERAGLPFNTIMTDVFGGRVYARLSPLIDPGHDDGKPPPGWVLGILMRLAPPFRRRIRIARGAVAADLPMALIDEWESGGRERTDARTRELRAVDRGSLSSEELAAHIEEILAHAEAAGNIHFDLGMISSMATLGALGRIMERELQWSVSQTLDLLQGYGEASAAAGHALDDLAAFVAADPQAQALLDDAPQRLRELEGPAGDAYRVFIERRGHRLFSMAIASPTWAEDPSPLFRLLRARVAGTVERIEPRSVAHEAEQRARKAIDDENVWAQIDKALQRARRARPYQDETEDTVFDVFGVLRYAALEAGQRLAESKVIPDVDAVWFLERDELLAVLRGGACDVDFERRRGEYRWAHANRLDATLGPAPMPPPDIKFPADVDEFLGGIFWALLADGRQPAPELGDADYAGVGCSPGEVRGRVRVVQTAEDLHHLQSGEILVCPGTTAAWSVAFPLVAGIITETGGPLSHPATLAREYGIPAVLCVPGATEKLNDGDVVRLDGVSGLVWRLGGEES